MQPYPDKEQKIWLTLAELFFLDIDPEERDFDYAADLIKEMGWNRSTTRAVLVELVAPVAGANLGYLLWPVPGEWAGFDSADLCQKIQRKMLSREKRPKWYYLIQDWYCGKMLQKLGIGRLLDRLERK